MQMIEHFVLRRGGPSSRKHQISVPLLHFLLLILFLFLLLFLLPFLPPLPSSLPPVSPPPVRAMEVGTLHIYNLERYASLDAPEWRDTQGSPLSEMQGVGWGEEPCEGG